MRELETASKANEELQRQLSELQSTNENIRNSQNIWLSQICPIVLTSDELRDHNSSGADASVAVKLSQLVKEKLSQSQQERLHLTDSCGELKRVLSQTTEVCAG